MAYTLGRNWWLLALSGIIAVLFGIIAIVYPSMTLAILIALFGAYAVIDGILYVVAAIRHHADDRQWWLMLLVGLVAIAAGAIAFLYPGPTAVALLFVIAAWAIITGILDIFAAVGLRREIANEWMLLLAGVISVVFGVLLVLYPSSGLLSIVWLIGIYAVLYGVAQIILAFRARSFANVVSQGAA
jgi:uncharacterized membrane protein HdeD (DUF308 family)